MKITIELSDTVASLLEVITRDSAYRLPAAERVKIIVENLVDHAQQGVYRPGAWERQWLVQAFGDDWLRHLEPGDPYGRPDSPMFNRPKRQGGDGV